VLDAATAALTALTDWSTPRIEEALRTALVEGLGRKPRQAFGPVRVAVSGRTVSPPLYESIEILGRERTLARLAAARAATGGIGGPTGG
jgi:glutamyl-tRNA synthetase